MKNTMRAKAVCALAAIGLGIGGCAEFGSISQYEDTPSQYTGSSSNAYNAYNASNGQLMRELVQEQQRQREMAKQEAEQNLAREQNDGPRISVWDLIPGPWQIAKGPKAVRWILNNLRKK